jgi:hypothetical protein
MITHKQHHPVNIKVAVTPNIIAEGLVIIDLAIASDYQFAVFFSKQSLGRIPFLITLHFFTLCHGRHDHRKR